MNPSAGGTSQAVRNLIPNLQKFDTESEVICFDRAELDYKTADNFKIFKIGKGKTSYQYHPLLVCWLAHNLPKYDAVIVHGIWQYHNYAIFRAVRILKKKIIIIPKVVIMPHGMLDPYFQKASNRQWKALRNNIIWKLTERMSINNADAIFFTCEEELLLAKTTFKGYKPKKEINVGFGIPSAPAKTIEMQRAFRQSIPLLKNKFWLFLSRIDHKKGVAVLIDAYNELCFFNQTVPDLVIAGPTNSLFAEKMIAKAKNNSKIHFPGMLTGEAKWGAFYCCEVYLLPSYQENFGIAIVEAMSCKKPVLISNNINIWKEIETGNGGFILNQISISGIKEQLKKISLIPNDELQKIGEQAHQTYKKKFSIRERAKEFCKTITEI
jgi:glycosyltransferase involved in cell wall biosynthesis